MCPPLDSNISFLTFCLASPPSVARPCPLNPWLSSTLTTIKGQLNVPNASASPSTSTPAASPRPENYLARRGRSLSVWKALATSLIKMCVAILNAHGPQNIGFAVWLARSLGGRLFARCEPTVPLRLTRVLFAVGAASESMRSLNNHIWGRNKPSPNEISISPSSTSVECRLLRFLSLVSRVVP